MAEPTKKRSFKDYIDNVIGGDGGLKSSVTVNLTTETIISLVGAATVVILIAHLAKNAFPNKQIKETNRLLLDIKNGLKG
jgi:hypothetical protein